LRDHLILQILKAFTPAITMVLAVGAGLEVLTLPLAAAVVLIGSGTGCDRTLHGAHAGAGAGPRCPCTRAQASD
jgi:hypothetical protein